MPRILAPNKSFQRRGSQHSLSSRASRSSRTSLHSEPPLRRSSLPSRGYQNAAYESAFSLRREGASRRQSVDLYNGHTNNVTQQNAQWDFQESRQNPKSLSKESLNTTASTQASSQSSSISTLPSKIGTSASGLAAAFALLMKQKAGTGGVAPNTRPEPQSVPCSPNPPTTLASSFDPTCMIKEEPDCWGQFVDVQSATEDLEKRSRVIRRYPGAPQSLPRGY